MADIGFIGTGNMGCGMALRLIDGGHSVRVFYRTKSKTDLLVEKGAVFAETPKQAVESVDAVIVMVGDDIASRAVWLGENGVLAGKPSKQVIAIECSTLSHAWVTELSAIVKNSGLAYLDCPVTGLPEAAAKGELTLFLGGDKKTIERAQPFLTPLAIKQIHFGEIGNGTAYKLIVNLMGSIQIAAVAEALLVAEKAGLDLKLVSEAFSIGAAASPQVIRNSQLMVEAEHEKNISFNASSRLKDTRYGVEFANKMGQQTPLGDVAAETFQKLVDGGCSQFSESKVIDILRS